MGYLAPWYQSSLANWGHHLLTYEQAKTNLGVLPTNHAELLEPWFRLLRDSREKLMKFTRDYYHMNGTAYPHAISNSGVVTASSITLNGTQMNIETAGETVKYCWDYFDCTGDMDFLREVGYPILKDVAVFYHEYLLTDEDGKKYIFPSRSQEFVNTVGLANEFMTNSIIDLCMVRHTLDKAAKSAELLDIDADFAAAWREDLAALPAEYAVWPDGTWKTAEDTDDRTLDVTGCQDLILIVHRFPKSPEDPAGEAVLIAVLGQHEVSDPELGSVPEGPEVDVHVRRIGIVGRTLDVEVLVPCLGLCELGLGSHVAVFPICRFECHCILPIVVLNRFTPSLS